MRGEPKPTIWDYVGAVATVIVVLWIVLLMGCNAPYHYATGSDAPEAEIAAIILNECAVLDLQPKIRFASQDRLLDGAGYGYETAVMACMAGSASGYVIVYPACLAQPIDRIVIHARHECCHVALGHTSVQVDPAANIAQEVAAEACAAERF